MKFKRLQSTPEWHQWLRESLNSGEDPQKLFDILVRNEFLPSSIRKAMGEQYPREKGQELEPSEPKSIFIALAALNEEFLEFTLDGLFNRALYPEFISVGLVDQTFDDNRAWLLKKSYWKQIRYLAISPMDSQGLSWARNITFSLYQDEDYLLQIDAHTLFDLEWDRRLVEAYKQLETLAAKPILSTYPPSFEFDRSGKPFKVDDLEVLRGQVLLIEKNPEDTITRESISWRFQGRYVPTDGPREGYAISGGFLFTLGAFVDQIPYDPMMYFQDEKNLALRAYTHGWTIYHVPFEMIPLFHLYRKPDDGRDASLHWHPDVDRKRKIKAGELSLGATIRLTSIIRGEVTGPYGLGNERSLAQFCQFSQIPYDTVYGK